MSAKSSAAIVMAWNWVIQYLARFKQVDSSTLIGVVKNAPVDDLGKDAREMVSLLILERLFINRSETTIDTDTDYDSDSDSSQSFKITFDPSEHCEDVLSRILDETSESLTEFDRKKWDVRPFIMHKRSSLPESPFQKFKELLLEGNHPLLVSLKDRSNLRVENISENGQSTNPVVDKDDLVSSKLANGNSKLQESHSQESNNEENSTIRIKEPIGTIEHETSISQQHSPGQKVNRVSIDNTKEFEFRKFHSPKNQIPQNVSDIGPSGQRKNSVENVGQLETDISDDERSDIAAKKEAFFSSQFTLSQDSMAMNDYNEIPLCVKCNKSGELLICDSDSCQFRVHENCLNSTATFDENGKYYCPFCAYSRAISKYEELKKKTSLARKDLQAFLGSRVNNKKKRPRDNNELNSGDKQRSKEARDLGKKVGETSRSSTAASSLHEPVHESTLPKNDKKESHVSDVSSRLRRSVKREPQYTYPVIPSIGRKKLLWTKAEEEILKEGVRRFSSVNNRGMPWKEILDFGKDVFQKNRTAIDLKDKWRNICKGSPEAKKRKI